jgi:hypothetical protein
MLKKMARLALIIVIIMVPVLSVVWLIFFDSEVGMAQELGVKNTPLPECDVSTLPQAVLDAAARTAAGVIGNNKKKVQDFVGQLLSTYADAKNNDVLVVFNSGGWGWNASHTSGWGSILDGMKEQLESEGYQTVVLNYRRTSSGIGAIFKEFYEAAMRYPSKAPDLAARIKFLTDNLPNLKVIIAGESTGTVISDKTMILLKDDPRVYSIQTGTPFWHRPVEQERTLLLNNNGATIDTFSYGDVPAMVWATVKGWFGLASPGDKKGNVLLFLKAPGHDYSWQYPGVYNNVVAFIKKNFGEDN